MDKSLRLFIAKCLVFLSVLIFLDLTISTFLASFLKRCPAGDLKEMRYAIKECNEELIIMGSSRARHHLVPNVLGDSLKFDVYNAGMDGQGIYYHYSILASLLKRYRPKLVLVDLTERDLLVSSRFGLDGATVLHPFYGTSNELNEVLELGNWSNQLKLLSGLYRYNSTLSSMLSGYLVERQIVGGYEALHGSANLNDISRPVLDGDVDNIPLLIDSMKMLYIHKFLTLAKENEVQVAITLSPSLNINVNEERLLPVYEKLADEYSVPLLCHVKNQAFLSHSELFKDNRHLNHRGAVLYSSLVAHELRRQFSKKLSAEMTF